MQQQQRKKARQARREPQQNERTPPSEANGVTENEAARKFCKPCGPSLTDLPDELLQLVLRSLTACDIGSLVQVSSRFVNVVADRTLWVSPDFCHQGGLTCDQFCEQYLPFLGPWTTSVATRGPLLSPEPARLLPGVDDYLSAEFLRRLEARCPNLKSLVLRDHHIDVQEVSAETLPRRLERLSFRHCGLTGTQPRVGDSDFWRFCITLTHLQELELDRCPWFCSESLFELNNCAHLRVLRITRCPRIVSSSIRHVCIFGFKSLEVLDLRETPVGDPELKFFSLLPRLEEVLLERPGATASPVANSSDASEDSDAETPPGGAYWLRRRRGRRLEPEHDPGVDCMGCCPSLVEPVSDTGICYLVIAQTEHKLRLRKLVVRGFSRVTDASVQHLALVNTLRHLDLTGCGVTRCTLETFAALRPDVEVVGLQQQ